MRLQPYQIGSRSLHLSVLRLGAKFSADRLDSLWQEKLRLLEIMPTGFMGELARKSYREYLRALDFQQARQMLRLERDKK